MKLITLDDLYDMWIILCSKKVIFSIMFDEFHKIVEHYKIEGYKIL
jgi:hypothetical protein